MVSLSSLLGGGSDQEPGERRSLGSLLSSLPDLIGRIIRGEIESAKAELIAKLKQAGIGLGFLVGAAVFGFILLEVLIAAAVLATATVFPAWLAALLVGAALLVVTAVLALIGVRMLRRGVPPVPKETIASVKSDINAVKGESHHEPESL
jgi:Putative Actinobacterial Holin-X, holin superfamily III